MDINAIKSKKIEFSIIVAVNNDSPFDSIFKLLESFYPQEGNFHYEFIVVEEEDREKSKIYAESFPWIDLVQVKGIKRGSQPRNMALEKAKGEIIVFLEDHITVQKDYLKNLKDCFSKGYDVVGGPVINGSSQTLSNWVSYFCHYHKWLPHIKEGQVSDLPGCNFAYRSELIRNLGAFSEGYVKLEFLFNERAKKIGKKLYFSHGLSVKHYEDVSAVGFLKHRFRYGRSFASNRKFSTSKRLCYAFLSPVIAIVEYIRILKDAAGDRLYLKKFLQCTPLLLLVLSGWAIGECTGYISGSKVRSKRRKNNVFTGLILKSFNAIKALITRKVVIDCDGIPYEFHNVPLKKIINWIRVEASVFIKPEKPWGWPTHLQIEPTTFCDLRCALCPVTEGMNRPAGNMDLDLFRKLIDEMCDYTFLILLWDWGEPFMNPDVYEMISYAKKKGIKVVSSSNGHIFKHTDHAEKLVKSGLDTLIIAIDGITQNTYERYRQNGNLETALRGLRTVVEHKKTANSTSPLVNFRFIVMRHNEHEVPELEGMARSLGVDVLTLKTVNPICNDTYGQKRSIDEDAGNAFLPKNDRYRRFSYMPDGKTPIRLKNNPCKKLWNSPAIHWNGNVCICTRDYEAKTVLGNLKENTFKEIWRGRKYQDMRSRFRSDWKKLDACSNCSYGYQGGSYDNTIAETMFFDDDPER